MVLLRDNLTEDFTGEQLFQNGDGRVRGFYHAVGKIGGAAIGAHLSHAPVTARKYLGLTLMPHSGVSLVLTGIAISSLTGTFSQYGDIVRGTIAAAAVINEVIAVFLARKGFQLAGELNAAQSSSTPSAQSA